MHQPKLSGLITSKTKITDEFIKCLTGNTLVLSPVCGEGTTPAARKLNYSRSPALCIAVLRSGEMINIPVKNELLDLSPAGPGSAAVPVNAVHSF